MVFLGLASNYSFKRIFRHLFAWGTPKDSEQLRQDLASQYSAADKNKSPKTSPSQVTLYHSGRSALAVAFQSVAAPGAKVILPGLTCIAVVRAIKAAGCTPVFSDIDPKTLQYDLKTLDETLMLCYNERIDQLPHCIILVQNTLGLPLDMQKLEALARKYHAIIVEDLAHCAGRFYPDGRKIGTVGAAAAFSFGKGKAIDTICGGALILHRPFSDLQKNSAIQPLVTHARNSSTQPIPQLASQKPRLSARLRDRWYPVIGGLSRTFWRIGLGKVLLTVCVKLHWVEKSADTELSPNTRLTHWQAKLAREQLANLPATPLREHYFVKDRPKLLQELNQNGYNLCETWYDTPVSPQRYADEVDFPADRCPNTIKVAEHIINLPTWYPESKLTRAHEIIKPYEVEL